MSGTPQQAEEADDGDEQDELTKTDFFDRLAIEGVTLDGSFFMPNGKGRQRRYFEYDPGEVGGFDPVRDEETGDVESQAVANHEAAKVDQVTKDHIEEVVFPKVRDGFGSFGLIETVDARDSGSADGVQDEEVEPMTDEEVRETIAANHEERGFFAEDDDGDTEVVSLAHPDARLMGYITGSHVKALPNGLETVDDYRQAVHEAVFEPANEDQPDSEELGPGDVPIATDDMMETFEEAGQRVAEDEELQDKLSRQVEARWEDGEYDQLRGDDEGE